MICVQWKLQCYRGGKPLRVAAARTRDRTTILATVLMAERLARELRLNLGVQAYVLRFPYLYLPSPRWDRVNRPCSVLATANPGRSPRPSLRKPPQCCPRSSAKNASNDPAVTDCHGATTGPHERAGGGSSQNLEAVLKASGSRGVLDRTDALPDAGHQ
jgi:hypothetical protein